MVQQTAFIERTDAPQPFHAVFKAGNGRKTFRCENLKTRAAAYKALIALGETFSLVGQAEVVPAALLPSGQALRVYSTMAQYVDIEVRQVDLRAVSEPSPDAE